MIIIRIGLLYIIILFMGIESNNKGGGIKPEYTGKYTDPVAKTLTMPNNEEDLLRKIRNFSESNLEQTKVLETLLDYYLDKKGELSKDLKYNIGLNSLKSNLENGKFNKDACVYMIRYFLIKEYYNELCFIVDVLDIGIIDETENKKDDENVYYVLDIACKIVDNSFFINFINSTINARKFAPKKFAEIIIKNGKDDFLLSYITNNKQFLELKNEIKKQK